MGDLQNISNGLQGNFTIDKNLIVVSSNVNAEVIENTIKTENDGVDIVLNMESTQLVYELKMLVTHKIDLGVVDKYDSVI